MNEEELSKIKSLINELIYSSTKNDGEKPFAALKSQILQYQGEIDSYLLGKLKESVNYAREASGRVKDKEHWIEMSERSLYTFENGIKREYDLKGE